MYVFCLAAIGGCYLPQLNFSKVRREYPIFSDGMPAEEYFIIVKVVKETTYYRKKVASAKNFRSEHEPGIKILIPLIFTQAKLQV